MAAPRKKTTETPAPDLSALAELSEEEIAASTAPPSENDSLSVGPSPKTTAPADDRDDRDDLIAKLQAQLAELQKSEAAPEKTPAPAVDDSEEIHIHFLEDGFNALGTVWYRGQELRIRKDSADYAGTIDRNGNTWLDMVDDVNTQWRRFGKKMFARGPWPGKSWAEVDAKDFDIRGEEDLAYYQKAVRDAQAAEERRAGAVPKSAK